MQETIHEIQQIFREARDFNEQRRYAIIEDILFFRGKHHIVPGQFSDPDKNPSMYDPRVMHATVQMCRPIVRQEVAFFLNSSPRYKVLPSNPSVISRAKAETKEKLANSLIRTNPRYREARFFARTQAAMTGAAWMKTYWDPYIGPLAPGQYPNRRGDINFDVFDTLDVVVDRRATKRNDVRYVFLLKAMPEAVAEAAWPVDIEGRPTKGRFKAYGQYTNQMGPEATQSRQQDQYTKKNALCEVVEYWEKSNGLDLPYGSLTVFSGDMGIANPALEDGTPYLPDFIWPWTLVNGLNKLPGKLYADGILTDIKPLQVTLNHANSRATEQLNLASMHHVHASRNAKLEARAFENIDGNILEYDGPTPPGWITGPGISPSTIQFKASVAEDINIASTQNAASRGIMENSQGNARLLSYQAKLGSSIHEPDRQLALDEDKEIVENALVLIRNNYDDERMLHIFGDDDMPMTIPYRQDNIDWEGELLADWADNGMGDSELAEAKALEVLQAGGFSDTPEAHRFRRAVGKSYLNQDARDPKPENRRRARNAQINYMMFGQIPVLRPQDDHNVFIEEDTSFISSEEFLNTDEMLQQQYMLIVAQRQELILAKLMDNAAQQNLMAPGKAPSPQSGGSNARSKNSRGAESPIDGGNSNQVDNMAQDSPSAG